MTTSTVARAEAREGFGRLAAALASSADTGTRLETRLVLLTVATRWITISAGVLLGLMKDPSGGREFIATSILLVLFAAGETFIQVRRGTLGRLSVLTILELLVTLGAIVATGGVKSPFILTPITPILLAGYVWGRRATVGTAVAGAIAAVSAIVIQKVDVTDSRQAGQIAVVFLLCGALGAFTRNLVVEMEMQRAAVLDQATQMATANDLLVSLHHLAQTLPASFDLGEVVESIRQRVRALFPYTALVVLVPDDAGNTWRAELTEGVRVAPRIAERDLPQPLRSAMSSTQPIVVHDRLVQSDENGFAPLARSGLYAALRARGALVGLVAIEHEPPETYGVDERNLLQSLSSVLALSLDNARWFGRLHTLGAESERGRIARELHDRIAQSLAYVTFELERLQVLPGEKREELENLHDVVRDIMQELRETIYQLRANVTEEADLREVAYDYLARFEERTGIQASLMGDTSRRLPYRVEQELWRIVQEALANVERHSGATRVTVTWEIGERGANLEIIDNGRGFDPSGVTGDHYGIVGMRERADAIGAQLNILSGSNAGTTVVVRLETAISSPRPMRRSA